MDIEEQTNRISDLDRKCDLLQQKNDQLSVKIDELEQYSRRNCLILHGLPESSGDIVEACITTINHAIPQAALARKDVDRAHRLGRQTPKHGTPDSSGLPTKPRATTLKFCSYASRETIFRSKRLFKGSGFSITESLTTNRMAPKSAQNHPKVKNAWTLDGRLSCLLQTGKKIIITCPSDLAKL